MQPYKILLPPVSLSACRCLHLPQTAPNERRDRQPGCQEGLMSMPLSRSAYLFHCVELNVLGSVKVLMSTTPWAKCVLHSNVRNAAPACSAWVQSIELVRIASRQPPRGSNTRPSCLAQGHLTFEFELQLHAFF